MVENLISATQNVGGKYLVYIFLHWVNDIYPMQLLCILTRAVFVAFLASCVFSDKTRNYSAATPCKHKQGIGSHALKSRTEE